MLKNERISCIFAYFFDLIGKFDPCGFVIFMSVAAPLMHAGVVGPRPHRPCTRQEAGSWFMVSDNSWWHYFFNLSYLIADSGLWYFQVCQSHRALEMRQKPFQLPVLVLTVKNNLFAISVFSVYYCPCKHDIRPPKMLCCPPRPVRNLVNLGLFLFFFLWEFW